MTPPTIFGCILFANRKTKLICPCKSVHRGGLRSSGIEDCCWVIRLREGEREGKRGGERGGRGRGEGGEGGRGRGEGGGRGQ